MFDCAFEVLSFNSFYLEMAAASVKFRPLMSAQWSAFLRLGISWHL